MCADDVLKYVGHTLDKHKGCDILDLYPGNGLWSQKLHEYLQPRSHVLVEPNFEKFQDYLNPLLKAPGSKYSLVEKDVSNLQVIRDLVADGLFPHQTILDPRDPKAQEPNNSMLVTGCLVWDPPLLGMGLDSMARQIYYLLCSTARSNDTIHAYGLARTLLWMQHDDFGPSVADSITTLSRNPRFMEMTQKSHLIVNGERVARKMGKASSGREPQYEIEGTVRALQRGRAQGMELPSHRRDYIHDFADDIERITNGTGITKSADMHLYLHEQYAAGKPAIGLLSEGLLERYENEQIILDQYPDIEIPPGISVSDVKGVKRSVPADHPGKDILHDYMRNTANVYHTQRIKMQIEAIADIGEAMYNLECKILGMKDGPKKNAALARLEELNTSWEKGNEKLPGNYFRAPASELDDRLAIRAPPSPRLQWDARPFEPLTMHTNEAWPRNRLSLISTEPIPQPAGPFPDYFEWLQDFITGLFAAPVDNIVEALDKMQHGLSDIIEECPSLKDPKKGGRLQMKHLRVRMLTPEMISELLEAYKSWPFKAPGSDHSKFFRHKSSSALFTSRQTG